MRFLAFAVGLLLEVATWGGLVATFVLPRGRTMFQRSSWHLVWGLHHLAVAASAPLRDYARRDSVLAAVGPVVLIIQLAAFLAVFCVDGALMLWPWSGSFGLALRQSAAALFIVTLNHFQGPTNNLVLILIAVSGGVTIALQIGYLPVLYQSFARRETLVSLMESRAGVPAWGPEVLMRHQLVHTTDALAEFYRDWELWAADVAESHSTHPALILFRSPVAGYNWLLSLLAVLDAAALQLALCPSTAPSEARLCLRMGFSALRRIATTIGLSYNPDPLPSDALELTLADLYEAAEQMRRVGFPIEREPGEAWPHFAGWRVNYEAIAYQLADELIAPQAPWSGGRRHLRGEVMLPDRPAHRNPDGSSWDERALRTSGGDGADTDGY